MSLGQHLPLSSHHFQNQTCSQQQLSTPSRSTTRSQLESLRPKRNQRWLRTYHIICVKTCTVFTSNLSSPLQPEHTAMSQAARSMHLSMKASPGRHGEKMKDRNRLIQHASPVCKLCHYIVASQLQMMSFYRNQ